VLDVVGESPSIYFRPVFQRLVDLLGHGVPLLASVLGWLRYSASCEHYVHSNAESLFDPTGGVEIFGLAQAFRNYWGERPILLFVQRNILAGSGLSAAGAGDPLKAATRHAGLPGLQCALWERFKK